MDIYSYINSRDIAEYCKKLNHQFNSIETAYLIHDNKSLSIEEKHTLYNEIMKTMPDTELPENKCHNFRTRSFFDNLRDYINAEQMIMEELKKHNNDTVYIWNLRFMPDYEKYDSPVIYSSFDNARDALVQEIHEFENDIFISTMHKKWLDSEMQIEATMNREGKFTDICFYGFDNTHKLSRFEDILYLFENMWIHVPTPFKKGDILCEVIDDSHYNSFSPHNVFVFDNICYWNCDDNGLNKWKETADSMDMTAYGYWIRNDGTVYWECMHAYHNLEYYHGELKDDSRILKTISEHMKGNIPPDLMLYAYEKIRNESIIRVAREAEAYLYGKDMLELAGVLDDKNKSEN